MPSGALINTHTMHTLYTGTNHTITADADAEPTTEWENVVFLPQ